ncbi:GNAT family N-acetyltransferase [Streptococcus rifensis]
MWEKLAEWAQFETERLILRPFCYQDKADLYAIMSNKENTTFLHPPIESKELCQQLLVEGFMRQPLGIWAIEEKETKRMIGSIRLENIQGRQKKAEIGYFLHRDFWRKGYGAESLESIVFLSFTQLGLGQLIIKTHAENRASQSLAQKLGFRLVKEYKGSDRYSHKMRAFKDYCLDNRTWINGKRGDKYDNN